MSLGEFDLIRHYFRRQETGHPETLLGIGDDAALLAYGTDQALAITVDTLVAGVHFLPDTPPAHLGHKVLAVNLSDLAAMGAEPRWVTLALTLPAADAAWLDAFSRGFFRLADRYGVELIGGDTTRGPLSITLQAMGTVARTGALKRSGAQPGDRVYMSGSLGSAGLGLKMLQGAITPLDTDSVAHQEKPEPRIELGRALRGWATACIDITDGLAADLGHILEASRVGAELVYEQLPLSAPVRHYIQQTGDWAMPLHSGDDYELCFTLPPPLEPHLKQYLAASQVPCTCIGRIVDSDTAELIIQREGQRMNPERRGYDHFAAGSK